MQVAGCHASWLATDDRPNRTSWLNCSTSQREKLIPGGRRTTTPIIPQRGEPGSPPHPETGAKDHRLGCSLCGTRACGGLGFNKEGTYNRMIVSPLFEVSTRGGSRTHTPLRARDFESRVSANSTTLATESVTVECIKSTPRTTISSISTRPMICKRAAALFENDLPTYLEIRRHNPTYRSSLRPAQRNQ